jgi:hypothetical protein
LNKEVIRKLHVRIVHLGNEEAAAVSVAAVAAVVVDAIPS